MSMPSGVLGRRTSRAQRSGVILSIPRGVFGRRTPRRQGSDVVLSIPSSPAPTCDSPVSGCVVCGCRRALPRTRVGAARLPVVGGNCWCHVIECVSWYGAVYLGTAYGANGADGAGCWVLLLVGLVDPPTMRHTISELVGLVDQPTLSAMKTFANPELPFWISRCIGDRTTDNLPTRPDNPEQACCMRVPFRGACCRPCNRRASTNELRRCCAVVWCCVW